MSPEPDAKIIYPYKPKPDLHYTVTPPKVLFKVYQLPLFGKKVPGTKINFRWTAQADYQRKKLHSIIKLQKVTITGSTLDGICGIQLSFTEDIHSPLFESKKKQSCKTYEIDTSKHIKFIQSRVWDERIINHFTLLDKESNPIMDSEVYYDGGDLKKQKIPQNMAIIGVYGVKEKFNLTSFGFLLWDISAFQNIESRNKITY